MENLRFVRRKEQRHKKAHICEVLTFKRKSLNSHGLLLFNGKLVVKKDDLKQCVKKTFQKSKSGGYKKLRA